MFRNHTELFYNRFEFQEDCEQDSCWAIYDIARQ